MAFLGEIIYAILRAVLPWLFSGQETTKVVDHAGLEDMDRAHLSGTHDLTLKDLPGLLIAVAVLVSLSGCALGGAQVVREYHLVEPGQVVEIVSGKVQVRAPGTNDVGQIEAAGLVALPKSVYRQLREDWIKNHPDSQPDTKPAVKPDKKPDS